MMPGIADNLARIREAMAAACLRAGRSPESVQLVAVSKRVPVSRIQEAVAAGQRHFGENYLQEARNKIKAVAGPVIWHFIGHLQSNKAREAAALFSVVETVERRSVAQRLHQALAAEGRRLEILVQINIGGEPQKSGVLPEAASELLAGLATFPTLVVRGLMTIPPAADQPEASRPHFRALADLAADLIRQGLLPAKDCQLSMGMSADFSIAIEEGATLVRVGTALFGCRR
ncbi:MAG: YggS family pyridoxal phosphate-dependent enzyme [Thermodesulfobacteriota bacterium]